MTFDVQHHFRLAFSCGEKLIRLETFDRREGVKRIRLCHRDHIVRNGIDAELTLEEVLHHVLVTQLGEIDEAVDIIRKVSRVCQANPISSGGYVFSRNVGFIQVRILVLDIKRFEPRLAVVEVIYVRIKADGRATATIVI